MTSAIEYAPGVPMPPSLDFRVHYPPSKRLGV
jgi:hypothetical protein